MFRTTLVALAIAVAAPVHAQVRVITGDIEHIYGPGGQLLDDEALQRQNERRESARMEMQREREITRRQEQLLAAEQARQAAQTAPYYESTQVGSYPLAGGRLVRSPHHGHTTGRRH
jgi:hypothetical protein